VRRALAAAALTLVAGCDGSTYTLYRNSTLDAGMRVHIATFDASDGEAYNRENCGIVRDRMQSQPGIITRFWCEKGRYQK